MHAEHSTWRRDEIDDYRRKFCCNGIPTLRNAWGVSSSTKGEVWPRARAGTAEGTILSKGPHTITLHTHEISVLYDY